MGVHVCLSNMKWNLTYWVRYCFNNSFRDAVRSNKKLENSHLGERCFIVGNGPSIKSEDLCKLKTEFVFSVNDIYRNQEIFAQLDSDIHTLIDPDYITFSPEDFEKVLSQIKSEEKQRACLCTTDFIKFNNLFSKHNIKPIYIFMHRNWNEKVYKINMSRNIYTVQNVVQADILAALALGFKTIYIMGCEMTSFYENLEYNATGVLIQNHAHKVNESDYKKAKNNNRDNTYVFNDYAITFRIFKQLNTMAELYGAKIINLTRGGVLDMFDRTDYMLI